MAGSDAANAILQPLVAQISWARNLVILSRCGGRLRPRESIAEQWAFGHLSGISGKFNPRAPASPKFSPFHCPQTESAVLGIGLAPISLTACTI
jgi:hypothetical protein